MSVSKIKVRYPFLRTSFSKGLKVSSCTVLTSLHQKKKHVFYFLFLSVKLSQTDCLVAKMYL